MNDTKNKFLLTTSTLILLGLIFTSTNLATANKQWNLSVNSITNTNLTYDTLLTMPKTTVYADLYCYGNLVTQGLWSGVRLDYILAQVETDPEAKSIILQAQDGYRVSVAIEVAQNPDVIIAYEKDDQPLTEVLRLVIPQTNGDVWIAWIESINLSTAQPLNAGQSTSIPGDNTLTGKVQTPGLEPTHSPQPPQATLETQKTEKQKPNETSPPSSENIAPANKETSNNQDPNQSAFSNKETAYYLSAIIAVAVAVSTAGYLLYQRKVRVKQVEP